MVFYFVFPIFFSRHFSFLIVWLARCWWRQTAITTHQPTMNWAPNEIMVNRVQECTLISKERRHALRITQGPRSRASIAACHSSFQTPHSSLGATYNFQLCDSVPDLTCTSNGGGGIGIGGGFTDSNSLSMLTNHSLLSTATTTTASMALPSSASAPRRISMRNGGGGGGGFSSYHSSNNNGTNGSVATMYSNTTGSITNNNHINNNNNNHNNNNSSNINHNNNNNNNFNAINGFGTPFRMQNHQQQKKNAISSAAAAASAATTVTSINTTTIDYDNDDNVVQLRRRNAASLINKITNYENSNANNSIGDKRNDDWMYRRPTAPNDIRHSCK